MARSNTTRNFVVGSVFLLALAAVGFITLKVTSLGISGGTRRIDVPFDRVKGLKDGDEVRLYGLRVGQVEAIHLREDPLRDPLPVLVTLKLSERITTGGDTRFEVQSSGPLGGNYVEVVPLKEQVRRALDQVMAVPGWNLAREKTRDFLEVLDRTFPETLEGEARARIQAALADPDPVARLRASLEEPRSYVVPAIPKPETPRGTAHPELFEEIGQLVRENREAIRDAINAIRDAMQAVNRKEGVLGALIKDQDLRDRVSRIVTNVEEISKDIREGKGTVGKLINDPKLHDDLQAAVERIDRIIADAEAGKGTLGRLLRDDTLGRDIQEGVKDLKEIVAKVNQGEGTAGQLVNNREGWDRAVFVLRQVQEAVEDFREQAPINTFVNAIFSAF